MQELKDSLPYLSLAMQGLGRIKVRILTVVHPHMVEDLEH